MMRIPISSNKDDKTIYKHFFTTKKFRIVGLNVDTIWIERKGNQEMTMELKPLHSPLRPTHTTFTENKAREIDSLPHQ